MENNSNQKPKPIKKQNKEQTIWSIKILILSFALSMCFGVLSELVLSGAGFVLPIVVIVVFVSISILFDMIGVAVTACSVEPFRAMASRKVRGSKQAIRLLTKSDRVASICCDVIGDVCGILSGAAGASIIVKIAIDSNSALSIIIASLVSAVVASLTIYGKSCCKKIAIDKSTSIVLKVGQVLSWFTPKNSNQKTTKQNKENKD